MTAELTPQQTKALNFYNSVSLKANAGSGKTLVLAKRYLKIALLGNIPLQRIAAITFTDKAAGELYKRISEEIETTINLSADKDGIRRLEKIRRQLISANISTIHSFCVNILREFPVESKLDANFTPIDQNTSDELIELSIEETLRNKLEGSTNEDCRYLIRLFGSKINLAKQLRSMINHRKIVTRLKEEVYNKDLKNIAEFFRSTFEKYYKKIFTPQVKSVVSAIQTMNDIVLQNYSENELAIHLKELIKELNIRKNVPDEINLLQKIKNLLLTKSISIKSRGYLTLKHRDKLENEMNEAESFYKDFSMLSFSKKSGKIELQLARTGKYLIDLFDDISFIYDQKKYEKGYLDYEDILLKTRELLKADKTFKLLSQKYDYLMVDEYQDTNETQYQIFMPLLDYLRKGNLFVVGDEKQSIYRFREAELEVFERTNTDIINKSGDDLLITLPDSFRMEPVICLFTNILFKNVFRNPDKLYNEVEHSDLICAKQDITCGEVAMLCADEANGISESDLISKQILSLIYNESNSVEWKDIAVLVRKRSTFKELEKKFTDYRIPYKIVGGRGFFQRQSIYDIYNYFSFLLDTNNDAALVGVLRSPFFSVSDLKLFEISLNSGNSFWEKLQNSIHKNEELREIVDLLKNNINNSGDRDFNTILRIIFENTNFISVLASRPDGNQELANLEKLQSLTNNFTSQGFKTLYDYVDFLKEAINKFEDEAQAGLAGQEDAISLLTLHQAKGLEFPAVFLYKCHEVSRTDKIQSKSISIDKNFGILTKVVEEDNFLSEYKQVPLNTIRDYIESRKNLAEIKRLFYVGVTRAKKYLYISTDINPPKYSATSFMSLLIDSLNIDLNKTGHIIEGELTYLINKNKIFSNITKELKYDLPIIREINLPDKLKITGKKNAQEKKFLLDDINDEAMGEIISATKVAAYMQCPLKYNLIYKYGYSELFSEFKSGKDSNNSLTDFERRREANKAADNEGFDLRSLFDVKGQIIHKILEKEIDFKNLSDFICREVESFNISSFSDGDIKDSFISDTYKLISSFYKSKEFAGLKSSSNYRNESEIYLKEKNHFLYGIIDKLIFDGKKIVIVDYKTDDIEIESIKNIANYYLNQLNFYANIVSKLHKDVDNFQIKIVFLKHPDETFSINYNRNDVEKIEYEISKAIQGILNDDSSKNLTHCNVCNFSVAGRCII
ncbi:MAG: UvrD-helicase domain-containing protein [Ignavibacteria bacterium]|jgi:ATP-dependent helicase/nuclease subunit A